MLRSEYTHENSLCVHEFISSLVCKLMSLLVYPKSAVEKNAFILPKEKKNTRKSNQELINSKEYQLKNPPAQNLKLLFFSFTKPLKFSLRSSENIGYKVGKLPLFLAFHSFCFVCFEEQNLHFAPFSLSSLVARPLFFAPNNPFLAPKKTLFNDNFALFSHVFHGSKGFYLYHSNVFLCFSPCV